MKDLRAGRIEHPDINLRNMFGLTDNKGHKVKPSYSKKYSADPEIIATANFIKSMNPRLKPKRRLPRPDLSILAYAALILLMATILMIDLNAPVKRTVEVTRTVTVVPQIDEGFKIVAGETDSDLKIGIEGWWNKSLETPCMGIEDYYTGMGFMSDWTNMLNVYNKHYSDGGNELIAIYPPSDLKKNLTGYDCEDIAHATRCLAAKYGTECSFWMKEYHGKVTPDTGEHLGVCCNVAGSWKCI